MITVKGKYENGEIKLLEAAPVKRSSTVLITFLEDEENTSGDILQENLPVMKSYLEEGKELDSGH